MLKIALPLFKLFKNQKGNYNKVAPWWPRTLRSFVINLIPHKCWHQMRFLLVGSLFLVFSTFQSEMCQLTQQIPEKCWFIFLSCSSSGDCKVLNDVWWVWTDSRTGPGLSSSTKLKQTTGKKPPKTQTIHEHEVFAKWSTYSVRFMLCILSFCTEAESSHQDVIMYMWTGLVVKKHSSLNNYIDFNETVPVSADFFVNVAL